MFHNFFGPLVHRSDKSVAPSATNPRRGSYRDRVLVVLGGQMKTRSQMSGLFRLLSICLPILAAWGSVALVGFWGGQRDRGDGECGLPLLLEYPRHRDVSMTFYHRADGWCRLRPSHILTSAAPRRRCRGVPRAGFQPATPLIGNSAQLELPGLLPRPPHGLPMRRPRFPAA